MDHQPADRRMRIVTVASLLAFVALTAVAMMPSLHAVDQQMTTVMQDARRPALETPMWVITFMGDGRMLLLLTLVTTSVLARRHDPLARAFPVIMLGSAAAEWIVKWLVARPRPRGGSFAFPSGHVFTSVAFFGGVVYLLWTRDVGRRWRVVGTAACVLVIAGITLSRLYLKFHWLTDVLGGVTGGIAYLLTVLAVVDRHTRSRGDAA
jgi:membrane-associated phospholipid phosphatase